LIEEWIQKIVGHEWVSLQLPTSILASRDQSSGKTLPGSYSSKYRCTTGLGAEKFEASSSKEMVKRHLWHPSIGR
jgi:hypothetical protein